MSTNRKFPPFPSTSGVLKSAGLASERAQGTRRLYRVDPGGVVALRVERFNR
jgi:hypothetical protein